MGVYYSHCLIPKDNTIRPAPDRIVALVEGWVANGFVVDPENLSAQEAERRDRPMAETGACFKTEPPLASPVKEEPHPEPAKTFWSRLFGSPQKPVRPPEPNPKRPFSIPPVGDSLAALSQPYALIEWAANPNAIYPMQTLTQAIGEGHLDADGHPDFPHELRIELSEDFVNPRTDSYGDAKQIEAICGCGRDLSYQGKAAWSGTDRIFRACPDCGLFFRPQDHPAEIVDGETGEAILQPGGLCHRFAIIIDFGKDFPIYIRNASRDLVVAKPRASDLFLSTCSTALGFELKGTDDYS
jgi:hypothetical protein